nr:uncharacterized protein LOC125423614 [Ziziphus jujuba var. spinosa]
MEEERYKLTSELEVTKRYLIEKMAASGDATKALEEKTTKALKLSKDLKSAMALASIIKADSSNRGYRHGWTECKKKYMVENPSITSLTASLSSDAVFTLSDIEDEDEVFGSSLSVATKGGSELAADPKVGTMQHSLVPFDSEGSRSLITLDEGEIPDVTVENSEFDK